MGIILGRGRVRGHLDATVSQQGSSSWVDNISRSTSNHLLQVFMRRNHVRVDFCAKTRNDVLHVFGEPYLLRKCFEPRANYILFMGRDRFRDLVGNVSDTGEQIECKGEKIARIRQ